MPYQYDPVITSMSGRERLTQPQHQPPHQYYPSHQQQHQQPAFDFGLYASGSGAGSSASAGGSGSDVPNLWNQFSSFAGSHTSSSGSGSSPDMGGLLPGTRPRWEPPTTLPGPGVPLSQQQQPASSSWYQLNEYRPLDTMNWRYDDKGHERSVGMYFSSDARTYPYSPPPPVGAQLSPTAPITQRHHPYEPAPRALPIPAVTEEDPRPPQPPKSGRLGVKRRQKYTRSRTGCLGCRARRIKCDEGRPVCRRCQVAKRECVFPAETERRGEHEEEPLEPEQLVQHTLPDLPPNWEGLMRDPRYYENGR